MIKIRLSDNIRRMVEDERSWPHCRVYAVRGFNPRRLFVGERVIMTITRWTRE